MKVSKRSQRAQRAQLVLYDIWDDLLKIKKKGKGQGHAHFDYSDKNWRIEVKRPNEVKIGNGKTITKAWKNLQAS